MYDFWFLIILIICLGIVSIFSISYSISKKEHFSSVSLFSRNKKDYILSTSFSYIWNPLWVQTIHPREFDNPSMNFNLLNFSQCHQLLENIKNKTKAFSFPECYLRDLYSIWKDLPLVYKQKDRRIMWYPHDRVEAFSFPILVKTRPVHPPSNCRSVLFRLNTVRHYRLMKQVATMKQKLLFSQKKSVVLWRGAPTGYGFGNNIPFRSVSRQSLVEKYAFLPAPWIDVGLVIPASQQERYSNFQKYTKDKKSLTEMLTYKYLLSVEGNDVATNLKWIMASHSVLMAPSFQIESWFLEHRLRPYIHYLPIQDDFSDVQDQFNWAEQHPKECERIISNANQYVEQFLNESREKKVLSDVLRWYLDHCRWTDFSIPEHPTQ